MLFGLLILNHLFNYLYRQIKIDKVIEGVENIVPQIQTATYDEYIGLQNTDPLFLAIKNAANISFLKSQIDGITDIKEEIDRMDNDIKVNNTQIQSIQQSLTEDINPPDEENEESPDNEDVQVQDTLTEINVNDEL